MRLLSCHHEVPGLKVTWKLFIGGSRGSRLNARIRERLAATIARQEEIVVGDANGADKAAQGFLQSCAYARVTVYFSGKAPRNNIGDWPTCLIVPKAKRRSRAFFAAKDRAMSLVADEGLMIWNGKSVGTLQNIVRLVRLRKPLDVWLRGQRDCVRMTTEPDWLAFSSTIEPELLGAATEAVVAEDRAEESLF